MIDKLKKRSGFTLAETLVTVLILLMVSAVVAGGLPAATNAYNKAIDAANAQSVLSTTVNALRDKLSTAWKVEDPKDKTLVFISADTGARTKIYLGSGVIMVQDYLTYDDPNAVTVQTDSTTGDPYEPYELVSKSAITHNLKITYRNVGWAENKEGEVLLIESLTVTKAGQTQPLAKLDNLYIRLINPEV